MQTYTLDSFTPPEVRATGNQKRHSVTLNQMTELSGFEHCLKQVHNSTKTYLYILKQKSYILYIEFESLQTWGQAVHYHAELIKKQLHCPWQCI